MQILSLTSPRTFRIAVAGASKALPTSLGADVVIDYRSTPDLAKAISNASPLPIQHVFDAVSSKSTFETLIDVLSSSSAVGKKKLITVWRDLDTASVPADIYVEHVAVANAYGKDTEFARRWFRILGRWLEADQFKPMPTQIMSKGFESVGEGLELLRNEKVNGKKLICKYLPYFLPGYEFSQSRPDRIADTPGL